MLQSVFSEAVEVNKIPDCRLDLRLLPTSLPVPLVGIIFCLTGLAFLPDFPTGAEAQTCTAAL